MALVPWNTTPLGGLPDGRVIESRTDTKIGDEEAGIARATFAENAQRRRKEEKERIAAANEENKKRLLAIKSKTDDGDGLIGMAKTPTATLHKGHDELRAVRDKIESDRLERVKRENAEHKARLAATKPKTDDDVEDEATGQDRVRLRAESAKRRGAQQEALKQANAQYFQRIRGATTVTDTKVWDDGEGSAGAMRSVVAAQSRARKEEEARHLAEHNAEVKERLANVHSKTDDGDGIQF